MKIASFDENKVCFDNGTTLESYHECECSEYHWADFSTLNSDAQYISVNNGKSYHLNELEFNQDLNKLIQPVEDIGFFIVATNGTKILINCYGENNGWYSTNLEIELINDKSEVLQSMDISNCQEIT